MFFENWGFTEWSTITTISLSVIAIVIAICSSRSTSKAAEKQIREIKQLAALQIDVSIKQLEAEIQKVMVEVKKSAEESMAINEINKSGLVHHKEYRDDMMRRNQESRPLRDMQIYSECSHNLNELLKNLNQMKKRLD